MTHRWYEGSTSFTIVRNGVVPVFYLAQQVRAVMNRHGLKFIKCGHIPAKADNDKQQQWVEAELKLL